MAARSPTEVLEREHRFIEKIVTECRMTAEAIGEGGAIDVDRLRRIVDFMRTYADKCHHGKEEILLFPALVKHGVPMTGCPIGALTAEHVQGRHFVGGLANSFALLSQAEAEARKAILENLQSIHRLYPNHIWKEDYLLFPMTLKVMTAGELAELLEKFDQVDRSIGESVLEEYEKFADSLAP
jgi:hemerythrin-like domain-containing protein